MANSWEAGQLLAGNLHLTLESLAVHGRVMTALIEEKILHIRHDYKPLLASCKPDSIEVPIEPESSIYRYNR